MNVISTETDYDRAGNAIKQTDPDASIADRACDNGGRMATGVLGNAITETRTYRTVNLLSTISSSNTNIGNLSYSWDANKNKTAETIGGVMSGYGFNSSGTTYDFEHRLIGYWRASGSFTQEWSLTSVGDWNSVTTNGTAQTRTHGPTHKLLTADGSNVSTDVKGNNTVIPASLRESTSTTASIRYVFGSYIDEPVARKATGTGGAIVYYHRNQQYSIYALSDSSGAVTERYAYTAYGQPTFRNASAAVQTSSAANNRYTYTSREWDGTIGLHHFRARFMSGISGRYCSRDPIGFQGSPYNLYESLESSPIMHIDPKGMACWSVGNPTGPLSNTSEAIGGGVETPVGGGPTGTEDPGLPNPNPVSTYVTHWVMCKFKEKFICRYECCCSGRTYNQVGDCYSGISYPVRTNIPLFITKIQIPSPIDDLFPMSVWTFTHPEDKKFADNLCAGESVDPSSFPKPKPPPPSCP